MLTHHGSTEIAKYTTGELTPWLEQVFLALTNMKNGDEQKKHQENSINEIFIAHQTTTHLTLRGMTRNTLLMNSEPLNVTYTPSIPLLKR